MRHYIILALMVSIVGMYLYLKVTGRIRIAELEILPALALRIMLFLVSGGAYAILIAKALRATWGYDASPFSILIYIVGGLAALAAAFYTTRWLTRE
ncbi:MAG TPA: hypothetical protein ENJ35_06415 [Gammaproteobacteria bacterium]|nr:hypothetical protein [Gammaproteobacteria bacterium]